MRKYHVIKSRRDISDLYRNGNRKKSSFFTITYRKNCFSYDRVAVLVSKKNGGAVFRNRLKRRIREIVKISCVQSSPCFDILIVPYNSIMDSGSFSTGHLQYEKWRSGISC